MYKFLVVDDDETLRTQICNMLQECEYEVMGAKDAAEAFSMLRNDLFDLVIAEIHMKDINGVQLMQQIHEEFKLLPVILVSSDNRREVIMNAIKKGAQQVIWKDGITIDDFKNIWQYVILWRKKIYEQKGKAKQQVDLSPNQDLSVSSNEDVSVSSDDE
ncbi:two-component response regulator ORR21-like [Apium graveolens]|uniref:two-component response regulator ORR21-like n=1 Tax=Apium graveolens TaxID=4045 RepID=UPI003D7B8C2A